MKGFTKEHSLMIKGVAIMLLLVYHLFHEQHVLREMQVNYAPFSESAFLQFAGFGNICVAVFVFLTAYGISTGIFDADSFDIKEIYARCGKRFAKLMLNFVIVYVTINLICFPYLDYPSLYGEGKQGILMMLCDATGLASTLQTPLLNGTWWYMKLAYILIFLVPLIVMVVKKVGKIALLLAFFAPFVVCFDGDLERYFFVAVLGVVSAFYKWPEKVMNAKIHPVLWWIVAVLGSVFCVLIRQNALVKDWFWNYVDAFVAFFIVCTVVMTVGKVPGVRIVLKFLGKHSMNIFLVHTFFYMIVWRKYIYYFEYAIATFLILLALSLLYSVVLEFAKEGVKKFLKILKKKVKKD
ncbi:MAG: acyltransferase family protein [Lachnospiraceae bacterium]|nr:acyltransferase family protein [Lachnospiraceae bacterium]